MAVFGIGARYDTQWVHEDFIRNNIACIGHEEENAPEIYRDFRRITNGDIIYMKSLGPRSDKLCIMGVGIVTNSKVQEFYEGKGKDKIYWGNGVKVWWIWTEEIYFKTNPERDYHWHRRLGTFYEECNPKIHRKVIRLLLKPRGQCPKGLFT